jgi:ABC-type nitrate/sulfonate/bicarbonate transport system permease component
MRISVLTPLWKAVSGRWPRIVLGTVSIILFVGAWMLIHLLLQDAGSIYAEYIPDPREVAEALIGSFGEADPVTGLFLGQQIWASLERIALGFLLAFLAALPLGLLMGRSETADALGRPIMEIFRPIPPLAWIPVFLLVFKVFWGPVAIVFVGIFFPVLLNVMFGARSVDTILIDAAKTLGAGRMAIFRKVVLPFTVPYLMTGIKVGLGIGWMCIVAAEMVAAEGGGIGYFILAKSELSQYEEMYAGMVIIGLLSMVTTGAAGLFERYVYRRMGMR